MGGEGSIVPSRGEGNSRTLTGKERLQKDLKKKASRKQRNIMPVGETDH